MVKTALFLTNSTKEVLYGPIFGRYETRVVEKLVEDSKRYEYLKLYGTNITMSTFNRYVGGFADNSKRMFKSMLAEGVFDYRKISGNRMGIYPRKDLELREMVVNRYNRPILNKE